MISYIYIYTVGRENTGLKTGAEENIDEGEKKCREYRVIWVDSGEWVQAGEEMFAVYTQFLSYMERGTKEIFVYNLPILPLCVCVCVLTFSAACVCILKFHSVCARERSSETVCAFKCCCCCLLAVNV